MANNVKKLTPRQTKLLKIIVEQYINYATPVSSKEIIEKYFKDLSSATIRNEMVALENAGFITKTHTSSGRVPTDAGYKLYQESILSPSLSSNIKARLEKIFAKRLSSIESIIEESVSIINETLKLPSIITIKNINETLKRIDLIPLNKNLAVMLVVTSSGSVSKNTITFNNPRILNDLTTCVRIFNDRSVDTPLVELPKKIESLKPIIQNAVENYEFIMKEMINKIFKFNSTTKTYVKGAKYLTSQPEFKDVDKLQKVLNLLEDSTIWQQIAYMQSKTGKTTLLTSAEKFGSDHDIAIASIAIKGENNMHQISVVGPKRMDYAKIQAILSFIKQELEKKYHD